MSNNAPGDIGFTLVNERDAPPVDREARGMTTESGRQCVPMGQPEERVFEGDMLQGSAVGLSEIRSICISLASALPQGVGPLRLWIR